MGRLTIRAYAKINLSLRIGALRDDGFHEVRTVLQSLELHDRLTFERRRGPFEIRCASVDVPIDARNLIWKAADRLWAHSAREGAAAGIRVTIEKQIPMQAGLGGGSADAAAALVALDRLWRLGTPMHELSRIAGDIGSDVPYFFEGGTALALGRGEEVYRLEDLPPHPVVLVVPPFGVSTADAYAWFDAHDIPKEDQTPFSAKKGLTLFHGGNDLEAPVVERHPEIGHWVRRLARAGAMASAMSGSGSVVFGVFTSMTAARRAANAVGREGRRSGTRTILTRFKRRAKK